MIAAGTFELFNRLVFKYCDIDQNGLRITWRKFDLAYRDWRHDYRIQRRLIFRRLNKRSMAQKKRRNPKSAQKGIAFLSLNARMRHTVGRPRRSLKDSGQGRSAVFPERKLGCCGRYCASYGFSPCPQPYFLAG